MTGVSNIICNYIYKNWIQTYKSQRSFALDHNIEESIVRKIKNTALKIKDINYNVPVNTLQKICDARNMKLSEFFKVIENTTKL
ncbi:transcriptional regulator [Flavobacterium johnsoniae]|uniref:Transcriptional regulator n=1 Tax=Flavobacterium johnsoniae TaxID=986 RepID=A0A1J7CGI2_FLAJO|nr:transcriptional regulator [Flavobacterium johnsoniae]